MSVTTRDSVREQVVVAVHDTLREVTTTTVVLREQRDSAGTAMDTVKVTTVTDRTRASDRSQLRVKSEELRVRTDTVYVEKRDSLQVTAYGLNPGGNPQVSGKRSAVSEVLRWVFWILVALIVLVLVIRFGRKRS